MNSYALSEQACGSCDDVILFCAPSAYSGVGKKDRGVCES